MSKNKIYKLIAAFGRKAAVMAVVTLAIGSVGMSASAANTGNKYFNDFYITSSAGGWTRLYQTDTKADDSYVYLHISSATRACRVHTLGISGSNEYECTSNTMGAYCVAGPEYRITNSIYENKYRRADLKFYSISNYNSDHISGAWSPDSIAESGHSYNYV